MWCLEPHVLPEPKFAKLGFNLLTVWFSIQGQLVYAKGARLKRG